MGTVANKLFRYSLMDEGNCEITPIDEIFADNIGHALQRLVARLPDEEPAKIHIWRAK